MSGPRVVFDGLWRCLCPSVDAHAAARLLSSPAVPRSSRTTKYRCPSSLPARHYTARTQCRRYGSASTAAAAPRHDHVPSRSRGVPREKLSESDSPRNAAHSLANDPDPTEQLRAAPLSVIYEALAALRGQPDSFKQVATIITYLVTARGVELSPSLYEHLVIALADVRGSAAMLAQLLAEMRQLHLTPTSVICHAALAALAVHPDYLVRNEVLVAMQQSWTEIGEEGQFHVALGLLRDGQFELALDELEGLIDSLVPVAPWVYDIFIFMFAQRGFVDEAVRLAHGKVHACDEETHFAMWHMLLDACSQVYHYEGTRYIWGRLLDMQKQHLSDGTLLNIVNTAARQHDFELVTNANRLIAQRTKLMAHHYEPLIECYGGIGDLDGALRVLCIMFNAISVAPYASTRSIYEWIKKNPDSLDTALAALSELVRDYKVPIAALNVLVEAAVETHGYARGLEIYKSWHKYTEAPPNHVTLRYLLQNCEHPESLRDLVAEDPEMAIKADRKVFADVIFEFVMAGDLEFAYRCVKLFGDAPSPEGGARPGVWINQRTLLALVKKSLEAQDERVYWLVEQAEKRNMDVQTRIEKLMTSFAEEIKKRAGINQETRGFEDELSEQRHP